MCPSYMVTHEEIALDARAGRTCSSRCSRATRSRTAGESEHVKEALDLCLACKGCKSDCPVNVDMATYKAEFLSHYYEGRLRPRHAYAMGLIYWWARLASLAPAVVNLVTQLPGVCGRSSSRSAASRPGARHAGVRPRDLQGVVRGARQRDANARGRRPRGASSGPTRSTTTSTPRRRRRRSRCWKRAGFQVVVPPASLCCGRPLYDFGMLDTAKTLLRRDPRRAAPGDRGRHAGRRPGAELRRRLPRRADEPLPDGRGRQAALGQQTVHPERVPATEGCAAIVRRRSSARPWCSGHCHHKAIMKFDAEEAVLREDGPRLRAARLRLLRHGRLVRLRGASITTSRWRSASACCCRRCGAPTADTLIIADGFSCREQIAQPTGRRAVHLAEALQFAVEGRTGRRAGEYIEDAVLPRLQEGVSPREMAAAALIAAGIGLGLLGWRQTRR